MLLVEADVRAHVISSKASESETQRVNPKIDGSGRWQINRTLVGLGGFMSSRESRGTSANITL